MEIQSWPEWNNIRPSPKISIPYSKICPSSKIYSYQVIYLFLLFQIAFQVLSMAWLGGFSRDPILLPFRLTLLTSVLRKGKEFGQQNCRGQNISKSRKNAQNNKKQQQQNIIWFLDLWLVALWRRWLLDLEGLSTIHQTANPTNWFQFVKAP